MSLVLQVLHTAALLLLVGCLIPMALQLRRSAKALESAVEALKTDFGRIAEDVHQTRLRVETLSGALQPSLEALADMARDAREATHRIKQVALCFERSFESTAQLMGALLGGLDAVQAFFRNRTSSHGDSPGGSP